MFTLLFFPFHLMAGLFTGMFSLMFGIFRGMFRFFGNMMMFMFSIFTGIWPLMLIGGAVSLILGLIRSLWPLVCVGALGLLCYVLYKAGLQHAKDHPDDQFAQFVNRVRGE